MAWGGPPSPGGSARRRNPRTRLDFRRLLPSRKAPIALAGPPDLSLNGVSHPPRHAESTPTGAQRPARAPGGRWLPPPLDRPPGAVHPRPEEGHRALRRRARPRARPVLRRRRHQRDERRQASGLPGDGRPGPAGAAAVLVRHRLRRQALRPARAATRPGTTGKSSAPTGSRSCTSARTSPAMRPTTCSGPSSNGRRARSPRTSPR
jgi:hypothetical protein